MKNLMDNKEIKKEIKRLEMLIGEIDTELKKEYRKENNVINRLRNALTYMVNFELYEISDREYFTEFCDLEYEIFTTEILGNVELIPAGEGLGYQMVGGFYTKEIRNFIGNEYFERNKKCKALGMIELIEYILIGEGNYSIEDLYTPEGEISIEHFIEETKPLSNETDVEYYVEILRNINDNILTEILDSKSELIEDITKEIEDIENVIRYTENLHDNQVEMYEIYESEIF